MTTTIQQVGVLTASDVMSRDPIVIPEESSLQAAGRLLAQNQITGAPVVDAAGRCIGLLSATDFVHWAEEGSRGAEDAAPAACPFQVKGRLLTGEEAVICTLAEGLCPRQEMHPTLAGGHTAVCLLPLGSVSEWRRATKNGPVSAVLRYMTSDVVTTGPQTPVTELARMMIDAHIHRVVVVDEERRPIGVVSTMDLLAVLASSNAIRPEKQSPR
jgi:CBS domain-containing protein